MELRGIASESITFAEPWQARAFALAFAVFQRGSAEWEEFRRNLIAEVGKHDSGAEDGNHGGAYYEAWLRALEASLIAKNLTTTADVDRRAEDIAAHPPEPTRAKSHGPVNIS